MTGRAIAETFVGILLGLVLSLVGLGLVQLSGGSDPATAFLDEAPRVLFGLLWPALIVWAVLVLIGNLRNRHRASGWKVLTNLVTTLIVAALAVLGWLGLAVVTGDWAWVVLGIALVAGLVFLIGASVGFLITHLLFFRHRPAVDQNRPIADQP